MAAIEKRRRAMFPELFDWLEDIPAQVSGPSARSS